MHEGLELLLVLRARLECFDKSLLDLVVQEANLVFLEYEPVLLDRVVFFQKNNALVHAVHYLLLSLHEVVVFATQLKNKLVLLTIQLVVDDVASDCAEQDVGVDLYPHGHFPV